MTAAWTDEARAVEGRPVAQEEAVALFTMHAAKGLEWPIVIPVNTMTGVMSPDSAVIDRHTDTFYCPVLGVAPDGYDAARQAEKDELGRERIRLWYVAATRARDLFVLPRLDTTPSKSAWIGPLDLSLADLPGLDVSHLPLGAAAAGAGASNAQTRAAFATEAAAIAARQTRLLWLAPCRDERLGCRASGRRGGDLAGRHARRRPVLLPLTSSFVSLVDVARERAPIASLGSLRKTRFGTL